MWPCLRNWCRTWQYIFTGTNTDPTNTHPRRWMIMECIFFPHWNHTSESKWSLFPRVNSQVNQYRMIMPDTSRRAFCTQKIFHLSSRNPITQEMWTFNMILEIKVLNSTDYLRNMDSPELQDFYHIITYLTTCHTLTIACTMDSPNSPWPTSTFLLSDCWNNRSCAWKLH